MSVITTSYNNFSFGQGDHDFTGRYDLPVFNKSGQVVRNFITNYKGTAKYRTGLERILEFQDCAMYEFLFNEEQAYICVFYNTKLRFLTYDGSGNFGWVLSGGSPLEITTPYNLAQSKELSWAQNKDVIYFVHPSFAPYKLTRTSSTTFTFATYTRTNDPFTSANNYPSVVEFYGARLFYAATNSKITTVWASKPADYEDHSVSSPIVEDDALEFTLSEMSEKLRWLKAGENSLIAGSRDVIIAINGGGVGEVITAKNIDAQTTSSDGTNGVKPIRKDGYIMYAGKNDRNVYYFNYNILTESFDAPDANIFAYDITKSGVKKLRWKKDRDDIVYALLENGKVATLNFNKSENIIGWHQFDTMGIDEDTIEDFVVITNNYGEPELHVLVLRDGTYYFERLAPFVEFSYCHNFFTGDKQADCDAYNRKIAEELKECIFLDSSMTYDNHQTIEITYDPDAGTVEADSAIFAGSDVGHHIVYKTETGYEHGRFLITSYTSSTLVGVEVLDEPHADVYSSWYLTFSVVGGLGGYQGTTVSIVTDGGYYDDQYVTPADEVYLDHEATHAVIGYKYAGIIKTFPLGFQFNGKNSQVKVKNVSHITLKTVSSAGGKVGTSLYNLQNVQQIKQGSLNYLPPMILDGTTRVSVNDTADLDKCVFIYQDEPLPFNVTNLVIEGSYSF